MTVKDVMTADVATCRPQSNLADVVTTMWHRDCGCLPVIDASGHVAGMITDRDIAIALVTKGRTADAIEVREVMTGQVFSCAPADDVKTGLDTMRMRQVHRLPVIDGKGQLKGVLSLNDVAVHAGPKRGAASAADVLQALQGICAPAPMVVAEPT